MKHVNITIVTGLLIAFLSAMFYLANQAMVAALEQGDLYAAAGPAIAKVGSIIMMFVTLYKWTGKVSMMQVLWGLPKALFALILLALGAGTMYWTFDCPNSLMSLLFIVGAMLTLYVVEAWGWDLLHAMRELYE